MLLRSDFIKPNKVECYVYNMDLDRILDKYSLEIQDDILEFADIVFRHRTEDMLTEDDLETIMSDKHKRIEEIIF